MLTLRPFNIGPPVYAHLLDYDVLEDGQSIGRIREERDTPKPGREWFWSLPGAHRAGVLTWGYGATLDAAKAAFRAHWEAFKNCPILTGRNSKGLPYCVTSRTRP
jgi:hypothetical protein